MGICSASFLKWTSVSELMAESRKTQQADGMRAIVLGSEVKSLSRVRLFATPWIVAYQAPPSMGFSRLEYWSGLPFPSPGLSS